MCRRRNCLQNSPDLSVITDLYRNLMLHGIPSGNVPTWHSFAPHCSPLRKIFVTNKFQSIWKTVFNYELQKNQLDEGGLSVKGELRACYLICCLFVGHETALRVTHTLTNTHPSAGRQRLKRLCKFSWALYKNSPLPLYHARTGIELQNMHCK